MSPWWQETLGPVFGIAVVIAVVWAISVTPWWRRFEASRPPHRDALRVERPRLNSAELYLEQRRREGAEAIRAHARGDQ